MRGTIEPDIQVAGACVNTPGRGRHTWLEVADVTNDNALRARPTIYKGVQMRSRLEAGFAQWLDGMGFEWEYEPECFASDGGQWLPDFRVDIPALIPTLNDEHVPYVWASVTYVEVKPSTFTRQEAAEYRRRMAAVYRTHPNAAAIIAQDGTAPEFVWPDGLLHTPMDWTWTGLWPIDARRVAGPWQGEWWKGTPTA
jgi:hypothetical protein